MDPKGPFDLIVFWRQCGAVWMWLDICAHHRADQSRGQYAGEFVGVAHGAFPQISKKWVWAVTCADLGVISSNLN